MKASEIMSTDLVCATPDETLHEVANKMVGCDCGAIPIVDDEVNNRLMGVVTDRDMVVRCIAQGMDPRETRASDCMSTDIHVVHPESSLDEVCELMSQHQIRRIPVVNEAGTIVGMVAQADLALAAPKPEVGEVVQDISKPYVS